MNANAQPTPHQLKAADDIVATIVQVLDDGGRVHAETAIASAARIAGTFLFRDFKFSIENISPGTAVFSDASNDAAPLLFNTLDAALRAFGVVTDPQKRINVQAEQKRSHLSVTETQVRLEAPIRAIAARFKLSAQEAAHSCSIAAGSLIRSTAEVLDPNIGFAVATYGFIEGLKTMPPPLAVSHVQRKPWYSFWK
jgi:hypothetical protein